MFLCQSILTHVREKRDGHTKTSKVLCVSVYMCECVCTIPESRTYLQPEESSLLLIGVVVSKHIQHEGEQHHSLNMFLIEENLSEKCAHMKTNISFLMSSTY